MNSFIKDIIKEKLKVKELFILHSEKDYNQLIIIINKKALYNNRLF